ncbi:MAG: PqqD family protein [Rhodospirillales bacterium]|nr:PqqD family protein [Rhodospirillales bacterium]
MSVLTRNEHVLARRHEGQLTLIFDDSVFKLDGVGEDIWRLIDGKLSVDDICQQLGALYESQGSDIRKDTVEFLELLEREGLVERA